LFRTKRFSVEKDLALLVGDASFTLRLSEPLILGGECKNCGAKVDVFDLASKFDERLAECRQCNQHSNVLRIVDAISYEEIVTAFSARPLPVKFFSFNHNDQQFILELED
jgi:hypothetical protein